MKLFWEVKGNRESWFVVLNIIRVFLSRPMMLFLSPTASTAITCNDITTLELIIEFCARLSAFSAINRRGVYCSWAACLKNIKSANRWRQNMRWGTFYNCLNNACKQDTEKSPTPHITFKKKKIFSSSLNKVVNCAVGSRKDSSESDCSVESSS